jgi:hypothetical protein
MQWRRPGRVAHRSRADVPSGRVILAGIPVDERLVLGVAGRLRDAGLDDTAETLEDAYDAERRVAALTIAEREAIMRVLEDCPDDLAELRGVLMRETCACTVAGVRRPLSLGALRRDALARVGLVVRDGTRVRSEKSRRHRPPGVSALMGPGGRGTAGTPLDSWVSAATDRSAAERILNDGRRFLISASWVQDGVRDRRKAPDARSRYIGRAPWGEDRWAEAARLASDTNADHRGCPRRRVGLLAAPGVYASVG